MSNQNFRIKDIAKKAGAYLKKGMIKFLINQNPTRQTSLGVSHLANLLLFKKVPPSLDLFPLEIVTKENLSPYLTSGIY